MFIAFVLPGVLLVFASFLLPVMAFNTLDFPELDLPQKAISEPVSSGRFLIRKTLNKKRVFEKIFSEFIDKLNLNT